MLDREIRLQALREFTDCFYPVWRWKLDRFFNVIQSDCPHESLIRSVFLRDGRRDAMEAHMNTSGMPVCCTVSSALSWVMAFETESGEVTGIYIKGPFFTGNPDAREKPSRYLSMQLTKDVEDTLQEALEQLPVLSGSATTRLAQIRLCCEYIDTHPEEKLTLEMPADKAGYTSCHLSRKFKQEMKCSIIDYIQLSKLERAKYLLVNTQTTVDEISDSLGFGTRSYFTSVFKKHTGQTPSDYRKEHSLV